MTGLLGAHSARFMFRDDTGSIDRQSWWRATGLLVLLLVALALVEFGLGHLVPRSPEEVKGLVQRSIEADSGLVLLPYYVSLVVIDICHVAMVVLSVCAYFVGAKRCNDLGVAPARALILPAAVYVLIFSPIISDQLLPVYGRWIAWAVFLAVAAWQVYELGFRRGRL